MIICVWWTNWWENKNSLTKIWEPDDWFLCSMKINDQWVLVCTNWYQILETPFVWCEHWKVSYGILSGSLTERKSVQYMWCKLMHGSILPVTIPPPPGQPLGTSPALRALGWGIVWSGLVPGVGGRAKWKITSCCSCKVCHFSVDTTAPDRVEKTTYFLGKSLEFVADWLEKNNLSKLKSGFDITFIINCWTNVHLMRTRRNGGRHKRNISSVCLYL